MFWFGHERKLKEIERYLLKLQNDNRDFNKRLFELDEKFN